MHKTDLTIQTGKQRYTSHATNIHLYSFFHKKLCPRRATASIPTATIEKVILLHYLSLIDKITAEQGFKFKCITT